MDDIKREQPDYERTTFDAKRSAIQEDLFNKAMVSEKMKRFSLARKSHERSRFIYVCRE